MSPEWGAPDHVVTEGPNSRLSLSLRPPLPLPSPICAAEPSAHARGFPPTAFLVDSRVLCVDWLELPFFQPIGARLLASVSWWVCFSASPGEVLPLPRLRLREGMLWGASPSGRTRVLERSLQAQTPRPW